MLCLLEDFGYSFANDHQFWKSINIPVLKLFWQMPFSYLINFFSVNAVECRQRQQRQNESNFVLSLLHELGKTK